MCRGCRRSEALIQPHSGATGKPAPQPLPCGIKRYATLALSRLESGIIEKTIRRFNGSSCIPDVDGGDLRPAAKDCPTEALSTGADAGATVPLQSGVRGMRQDSVPSPHPET